MSTITACPEIPTAAGQTSSGPGIFLPNGSSVLAQTISVIDPRMSNNDALALAPSLEPKMLLGIRYNVAKLEELKLLSAATELSSACVNEGLKDFTFKFMTKAHELQKALPRANSREKGGYSSDVWQKIRNAPLEQRLPAIEAQLSFLKATQTK